MLKRTRVYFGVLHGMTKKVVYLSDSHTAQVLGKGKVMLKFTSGKTLALNEVLHVPNIRAHLVSVALLGKVWVKVSFESNKIVMKKNNVFLGKGFVIRGSLCSVFMKL